MPSDDDSHRIHIAANDPAFPAKREAAVALLCETITSIATPFGYLCKGTTWSRQTAQGRSAVNLQRGRYGWNAFINLRFVTAQGTPPMGADWADAGTDDIRINRFCQGDEAQNLKDGAIAYLDAQENSAILHFAMQILQSRALPWLDAHHHGQPTIASYLPIVKGQLA